MNTSHKKSLTISGNSSPRTPLFSVGSRRWFLQTGYSSLAALPFAALPFAALPFASMADASPKISSKNKKSVLLFWLSGGPSHLDMWDPKPDAPAEVRGPFKSIATTIPGVRLSEHLPLQASIAHKLTILRSVDCQASNHTPITMQAGNDFARRTDNNKDGDGWPSMGSIVSKFKGSNDPALPPFIALADSLKADVWGAGHMGGAHEPIQGNILAGKVHLPKGLSLDNIRDRDALRQGFDKLERSMDATGAFEKADQSTAQAMDLVMTGKARQAFDLSRESEKLRDTYGRDSLGEKALLGRRLVEAGASFVVVSGAWGYFDHHGDDVRWGGIEKGLKPLLPRVDLVFHALIQDLENRGMADSTLVYIMGEFGRAPTINKNAGRDHWTNCMSMLAYGGDLPKGKVIGATDARGYGIKENPITSSNLAATVFSHLDIDSQSHWIDPTGRLRPIITGDHRTLNQLV